MSGSNGNGTIKTTTDLALMAFYMMRGVELVKVERRGQSDQCLFHFGDPEGRAADLRVEWANSEMRLYDGCVRTLRKMMQEMRSPRRRGRRRQGQAVQPGHEATE